PRVGLDDNFFGLGGDSIVAIQVVGRARKAGLVITPRDIFRHQTVEALAASARPITDERHLPVATGTGTVPLTPLMHRFIGQYGLVDEFCQSMRFQVPTGIGFSEVQLAVETLIRNHDALRARAVSLPDEGRWLLNIPSTIDSSTTAILERVDLAGL